VADAITAYLAGVQEKLRVAEIERTAAEAREEEAKATAKAERKSRQRAGALAIAVLLAVALAGTWTWWRVQQRMRVEYAALQADDQASLLQVQKRYPQALAEAQKAEVLLQTGGGGAALRERVAQHVRNLKLLAEFDRIWMVSKVDERDLRFDRSLVAQQYADAFREWGLPIAELREDDAATRICNSELTEEILNVLEDWASEGLDQLERSHLRAVLATADPDSNSLRNRVRQAKGDKAALRMLAEKVDVSGAPRQLLSLAFTLVEAGAAEDGANLLRRVQMRRPNDFWVNHELGRLLSRHLSPPALEESIRYYVAAHSTLPESPGVLINLGWVMGQLNRDSESERYYREAIRLKPDFFAAHYGLGVSLHRQGRHQEAEAAHRKAVELNPGYAEAHYNLGIALHDQHKLDESIVYYRVAIDLRPNYAEAYVGLGVALYDQRHLDEAITAYRLAIKSKPDHADAHYNVGVALTDLGKLDEAAAAYRKAIEFKPDYLDAYLNLGAALSAQQRHEEAEVLYRQALQVKSDDYRACNKLGNALSHQGRHQEAEAAYRHALRLKRDDYVIHNNLGNALTSQGHHGDAEAAYRDAIRLRPDCADAYCNLGRALREQGRLRESLTCLRRGDELGSKSPDWRSPSDLWVRQGEYLVKIEDRLDAFLNGKANPTDTGITLSIAYVCQVKRLFASASRFSADAFAFEPKLANDIKAGRRYAAARCAAMAVAGKGEDAAKLDDAERARLRRQAIDWLQADLNLLTKMAGDKSTDRAFVEKTLKHWKQDADLANLREAVAVSNLLDQEQTRCRKLWSDVDSLLKRLAEARYNLGNFLGRHDRHKEAEAAFREAIRIRPEYAEAHDGLGVALRSQHRYQEAEPSFREAIRLRPDRAEAHNGLGVALYDLGRYKESEAACREAIRLKSEDAMAHCNLGNALCSQGRYKESEAAYREAIRLKPDYAKAHNNLGNNLSGQGRYKEAEAAYREAIRLNPDYAEAHNGLGATLGSQRRYQDAQAAFREAIRLHPDDAVAHCNLGRSLQQQGRLVEAVTSLKRGNELGSKLPGWSYPSERWLREAEQLLALDSKLSKVLKGELQPADVDEHLAFARLCLRPFKRYYFAATRFYVAAFAAEPQRAENLIAAHRYNAASAAALAGCGQGEDTAALDDNERARLRRRAVDWLRADLAARMKLLDRDPERAPAAVAPALRHWQQDADLAGLRDKDALAKLPEAERNLWQKLWADVDALLKRVTEKSEN
jgi:tetratricopeptide (TPR) repeat protein